MICYAGWVWEGVSDEAKPTEVDGAFDGHILKELDTRHTFTRYEGRWIDMLTGLCFINCSRFGKCITDASGVFDVVFPTPLVMDNYTISLSLEDGAAERVMAFYSNIRTGGFRITTRRAMTGVPVGGVNVSWAAQMEFNP